MIYLFFALFFGGLSALATDGILRSRRAKGLAWIILICLLGIAIPALFTEGKYQIFPIGFILCGVMLPCVISKLKEKSHLAT